jgi:hypothetical protein
MNLSSLHQKGAMGIAPVENLFTDQPGQCHVKVKDTEATSAAFSRKKARVVHLFVDVLKCFIPRISI